MLQDLITQQYFSLKFLAALGSGLIAGVFFAFSSFVMSALARLQPKEGIVAMQAINITVINPLFMLIFLGTAVLCLFLIISLILRWTQFDGTSLWLGCLFYLIGTLGVTIVCNVPLNEALGKVDPNSTSGASLWSYYLTTWTLWNHVRTLSALVAAISFTISLSGRTTP